MPVGHVIDDVTTAGGLLDGGTSFHSDLSISVIGTGRSLRKPDSPC